MKTILLALFLLTAAALSPAEAVGFQIVMVPDPGNPPLELGIWYPSDAPVPPEANTPFHQALSRNGPAAGWQLPLIVISHGKGGGFASHPDTALALAEAGFVVAAMTHTGDNWEDESAPASRWMLDRPRHVSRVIDYMLGGWIDHARIDAGRVGIYGFSAGAYTALVSSGGVPNIEELAAHCDNDPAEVACSLVMTSDFPKLQIASRESSPWIHDPRIKAAVLAAVGLGFAFDKEGLAGVEIPVQLWTAAEDRNAPEAANADPIRAGLPNAPEFHRVEGASHFAFRPPCDPKLEAAEPKIWAMICVDAPGFDRAAFHRSFNAAVIAFFRRALNES
jgi:predicted dienelactone hydrolase